MIDSNSKVRLKLMNIERSQVWKYKIWILNFLKPSNVIILNSKVVLVQAAKYDKIKCRYLFDKSSLIWSNQTRIFEVKWSSPTIWNMNIWFQQPTTKSYKIDFKNNIDSRNQVRYNQMWIFYIFKHPSLLKQMLLFDLTSSWVRLN